MRQAVERSSRGLKIPRNPLAYRTIAQEIIMLRSGPQNRILRSMEIHLKNIHFENALIIEHGR